MPQTHTTFADLAIGSIGPDNHFKHGNVDPAVAAQLVEELNSGEYYIPVSDKNRPNAPGGTFSLVVADALTTQRFMHDGDTAYEHAKSVFTTLIDTMNDEAHRKIIPGACIDGRNGDRTSDSIVGGHDGEHGEDDCGAQKRLTEILGFIASRGADIRSFLESQGIAVDDETHDLLLGRSQELATSGYVSDGLAIRKAYTETAGEDSVVTLKGNHGELEAELNFDPSVTLDREQIAAKYGPNCNVFNVDIGVFGPAAEATSISEKEAKQKEVALHYYTVATSAVLGHTSLPVTPRNI
ncbi:MAG: hypothetical protein QG629_154 [Patescibacteria group bacterium]|nr:hypothetical protein [Patescibacteria group bacterium]